MIVFEVCFYSYSER